MSDLLYRKDNFVIFKAGHGVIVQNTSKDFSDGHSHLRNFKSAKDAIRFVQKKKIPKRVRGYYLMTLYRISSDEEYKRKVMELINVREQKGGREGYFNPQRGVR